MSDLTGNKYSCCMDNYTYVIAGYYSFNTSFVVAYLEHIAGDMFLLPVEFFKDEGAFKLKKETVENQTETKQYIEHFTGRVYDVVFEGETTNVLKSVEDGQEVCCYTKHLKSIFTPYTKEMQKQTKKKQDLSTLETISETVKKCLDDDYVICHSRIDRDDGLITVNIVMGKEV